MRPTAVSRTYAWRVCLSRPTRAHLLCRPAPDGITERLCNPGYVVNDLMAVRPDPSTPRCTRCAERAREVEVLPEGTA